MSLEVTKESIRQQIWNYLEDNNLAQFPRPVFHRIPNFKGAEVACEKLKGLEEFQNARVVKVNPDKPQQHARFLTLEANKTLLVPTPRLQSGLFNQIIPPPSANKYQLRLCSSSEGVKKFSLPVGLDSKVKVDVIILGSVAVSKSGHRIGKGEGYADMEYAMMTSMGAIDPSVPVISTVHDCQVFDMLPDELFGEHDVPVDIIVTPTQVIHCQSCLLKPKGIIWSLLSEEKLRKIPILKILRNRENRRVPAQNMCLQEASSEVTKDSIRQRIWNYLEKNGLADFPRPVFDRIPNFKGADVACNKLKDLDEFRTARVVKISPDKPQQCARLLTLQTGKELLVSSPRLRSGLLYKIIPPPSATGDELSICSSSEGTKRFSVPIDLDSEINIDLIVNGCVAVSKSGLRIGKGQGYADMGYAMLKSIGAIGSDTPVVTIVHDCQVLEELPQELFGEHDVPVDIIVTPTQIIRCFPRLIKPKGIIRSLLTKKKLNEIPMLKSVLSVENKKNS